MGFAVQDTNSQISFAGCCQFIVDTELEGHLKALSIALRCIQMENIIIHKAFFSSLELLKLMEDEGRDCTWRLQEQRVDVQRLLQEAGHPELLAVPRQWNSLALSLADRGLKATQLSLYHQGLDRPRWLMRTIERSGFI